MLAPGRMVFDEGRAAQAALAYNARLASAREVVAPVAPAAVVEEAPTPTVVEEEPKPAPVAKKKKRRG